MWATLYRILIGLKWGSLVVFLARRRLKPSVFTEEWLEGVYAFTTAIHSLLLDRCTVSFKTQHLTALPFLSPSSRVPAGKSAACQKRVRTMKMYECEFHDAGCSCHAVYAWPRKHSKYLASTLHVEHPIPVAITARVQLKSPDGERRAESDPEAQFIRSASLGFWSGFATGMYWQARVIPILPSSSLHRGQTTEK